MVPVTEIVKSFCWMIRNSSGFAFILTNVPICVRNLSWIRFAREMLWLSAGILPVGGQNKAGAGFSDFGVQFQCSQPEVYADCLLRKSLSTNKVAIGEVQKHCVRKRVIRRQKSFYCYHHTRQMKNNCVAEPTTRLLEPGRQDCDSFVYI